MILFHFPVDRGDRVVVLGAHVGDEVERLAERVGRLGVVLALEPEDRNYWDLRQRVIGVTQVKPLHFAIWGSDGSVRLSVGTNSTNHSLVKEWGRGSEVVEAVTWDTLTAKYGEFKLCVMDIEGAEAEVIRTMTARLPKFLIVEYHTKFGIDPDALVKALEG